MNALVNAQTLFYFIAIEDAIQKVDIIVPAVWIFIIINQKNQKYYIIQTAKSLKNSIKKNNDQKFLQRKRHLKMKNKINLTPKVNQIVSTHIQVT